MAWTVGSDGRLDGQVLTTSFAHFTAGLIFVFDNVANSKGLKQKTDGVGGGGVPEGSEKGLQVEEMSWAASSSSTAKEMLSRLNALQRPWGRIGGGDQPSARTGGQGVIMLEQPHPCTQLNSHSVPGPVIPPIAGHCLACWRWLKMPHEFMQLIKFTN